MNLLITGGSGFIGKHLAEHFYPKPVEVCTPTHSELELTDLSAVRKYLRQIKPDVIIHCASKDAELCLENNLYSFLNLTQAFKKKIIYFGSGAENKNTEYGISKKVMNCYAERSDNVYNLRLYAVYGKYERATRFPAYCLEKKKQNESVAIPIDRWIDYLYIKDLCKIVEWFVANTPRYHSYDVCTGKAMRLSEIAATIGVKYTFNANSWSVYGGTNKRLLKELPFSFTPFASGIKEYASS